MAGYRRHYFPDTERWPDEMRIIALFQVAGPVT
jgi:hypothetical protein